MTYIIAEAGVNHGGRLDVAIELIAAAKAAGADACKFQAFSPSVLVPGNYERQAMLKGLALTREELIICAAECGHKGIEFLCTPMDMGWLKFLTAEMPQHLRQRRIKIGSAQVGNTEFIAAVARTGLPVLISNGMATPQVFQDAVDVLRGSCDVTVMACVSRYPTPDAEISMGALTELAALGCRVGFSSHARSFWPCVAAVYAGAVAVEAHLKLLSCSSPDAESSLLPEDFAAMVREIRGIA